MIFIVLVEIGSVVAFIATAILAMLFLSSIVLNEPESTALYLSLIYVAVEVGLTAWGLQDCKENLEMRERYIKTSGLVLLRIILNWLLIYYFMYCVCYTFVNPDGFLKWLFVGILGFLVKVIVGAVLAGACVIAGAYMNSEILDGNWKIFEVGKFLVCQIAILVLIIILISHKMIMGFDSILQPIYLLEPK